MPVAEQPVLSEAELAAFLGELHPKFPHYNAMDARVLWLRWCVTPKTKWRVIADDLGVVSATARKYAERGLHKLRRGAIRDVEIARRERLSELPRLLAVVFEGIR